MNAKRILIVDDEYVTLAMLEDILTAQGYQVITANRATTALQEALYSQPSLILLDIILPDRDGFSVLSELKKNERTRDIPVILMSALAQSQSFHAEQAAAFLHKPITQDTVLALVERILKGG